MRRRKVSNMFNSTKKQNPKVKKEKNMNHIYINLEETETQETISNSKS
jgi:hypothetical protein